MLQQAAHRLQHIRRRAGGLQDKPFIHHQTVLMPLIVVLLHQRVTARQLCSNRRRKRCQRIGHIVCFMVLLAHQHVSQMRFTKSKEAQAGITQSAFCNIFMLNTVLALVIRVVNSQQLIRQFSRQSTSECFAYFGNSNRVDDIEQFSHFIDRRQRQDFCRQRWINLLIKQYRAESISHMHRQRQRLTLLMTRDVQLDVGCQQTLRRIPAGEIITRMTHQEGQLLIAPLIFQFHWRREFAQQRRHRLEVDIIKDKGLFRLSDVQHGIHRMTAFLQRDHFAFVIIQFDGKRNMQRLFFCLIRRGWRALADGQGVLLGFRIVVVFDGHNRRAGLAVPTAEMGEIDIRRIFHRLHKVVAGCRAAIMALEIKLHPFLEVFFAQQGVDHANHFRALLVNGQGVEVVHLNDHIRADRVRHRAGVFRKLQSAHGAHIIDTVYRAGTKVRAEFLIAEDG